MGGRVGDGDGRVLTAVAREVEEVRLRDRRVLRVRVSEAAPVGSVVALPLTIERIKSLSVREVGIHRWFRGDPYEVLIHPVDWVALLKEIGPYGPAVGFDAAGVKRVMGLPVVHS